MTQKNMAELLHISRQAYSEKERGHVPFKDSEKIKILALYKTIDSRITIESLFFAR